MDDGIAVRQVTRRFGTHEVVRGVDLAVPYGRITGLIGPNGAGKTTLMLMLATLLAPDSGSVHIAGRDAATDPGGVRDMLGWMPDTLGVYDRLSAAEYLAFFAAAHRTPRAERARRLRALLALVRLEEYADVPVHVLSRGQKQRLGVARALVHRPRVLILDEPASGLDPHSRLMLRDLLRRLAGDGMAVLLSSHVLADLEETADEVVLMNGGRIAATHSSAAPAAQRVRRRVHALDPAALTAALAARPGVGEITSLPGGAEVGPLTDADAAALLAYLTARDVPVVDFAPARGALDSAYLAMTEGGAA
ncbi:ABC transporter ATP-binding protein [Actinomadura flavalba]|uniref:ABC transporter ATP-binding protein n=1 Tax=Actinomadura flavalba TaxID=1120938 RepID=UPI00037B9AEB|nr:ATP-binding cassette domain-containing protein [Actinomadura flavalba]